MKKSTMLLPIDRLVAPCVAEVVKTAEAKGRFIRTQTSDGAESYGDFYFTKEEIIKEILSRRELAAALEDLRRRYGDWHFDVLVRRYIVARVGRYLQDLRDQWGLRVYENYRVGGTGRRWLPMRFVTADRLRVIMQETRVVERDLHIKGEGYHIALARLEALEAAGRKKVRLGDILSEVGPQIQHYRLTGQTPDQAKEKTA